MSLLKDLAAVSSYSAYLIVGCLLALVAYRCLFHPLRRIPGPLTAKFSGLYGAYHARNSTLHRRTLSDHRRYGPIVRQGPNKVVFNTVAALQSIYQNEAVTKSRCYHISSRAPDLYGLFNMPDKAMHRAKRKLTAKVVNDQAMRRFEPVMLAEVQIYLQRLLRVSANGQASIDMSEVISHLTMDIMGQLTFRRPMNLQTEDTFRFMIEGTAKANYYLNVALQLAFLPSLRIASSKWVRSLIRGKNYFQALDDMIKRKLTGSEEDRNDLLFMNSGVEFDQDLEEAVSQIRSEAIFFLTAGSDTTAAALEATFWYVARNRRIYDRLAREIRSKFASGADICSGPCLASCAYLRACIDEALRMNPPLPGTLWREQISTTISEPLVIDGHFIPPGTEVGVNAYSLHHNEDYFPEPFTFKPERWLEESGASAANRQAFVPFSIGARACAGKAMAYTEISLIIARTLWYFDFDQFESAQTMDLSSKEVQRREQFPIKDNLTAVQDGPYLRMRPRPEYVHEIGG